MRLLLTIVLFFFCSMALTDIAIAQDYQISYYTAYSLTPDSNVRFDTSVEFTIQSSEHKIDKLTLDFPPYLSLSDLKAVDDKGPVIIKKRVDKNATSVDFSLNSPQFGVGATNKLRLLFTESGLTTAEGGFIYVNLPSVQSTKDSLVSASFTMGDKEKFFIESTPKPTRVESGSMYWDSLQSDTIKLTFVDPNWKGINSISIKQDSNISRPRIIAISLAALLTLIFITKFLLNRRHAN